MEYNIGGPLTIPTKLKDTIEKVSKLDNKSNSELLIEFYEYLRAVRTSERYQSDILKVLVKTTYSWNERFGEFWNNYGDFISLLGGGFAAAFSALLIDRFKIRSK